MASDQAFTSEGDSDSPTTSGVSRIWSGITGSGYVKTVAHECSMLAPQTKLKINPDFPPQETEREVINLFLVFFHCSFSFCFNNSYIPCWLSLQYQTSRLLVTHSSSLPKSLPSLLPLRHPPNHQRPSFSVPKLFVQAKEVLAVLVVHYIDSQPEIQCLHGPPRMTVYLARWSRPVRVRPWEASKKRRAPTLLLRLLREGTTIKEEEQEEEDEDFKNNQWPLPLALSVPS